MGLHRMGPPVDLILLLQEQYYISTFIETGTFHGKTALWASNHFEEVLTVEFSEKIYKETVAKYSDVQNIIFLFGDSRSQLDQIAQKLESPAVFWLDSHWCGGLSYGEEDQCPILDEIEVVNQSSIEHFLLIDDARLFKSPPPEPNLIKYWPTIDEVIRSLRSKHDYYILIFEDVIIAVPQYAKDIVANYCQQISTKKWNERNNQLRYGFTQIIQGVKLIRNELYSKIRSTFSSRSTQ